MECVQPKAQLTYLAAVSSPEEEKEKIIEEMLASAADATPNAVCEISFCICWTKRVGSHFQISRNCKYACFL